MWLLLNQETPEKELTYSTEEIINRVILKTACYIPSQKALASSVFPLY